MQLRMKLATVAVTGAAAVALAGVPALASSHASASRSITGPEVIAGAVHGKKALANATIIPLRLRGLVNTHSALSTGGHGPHKGNAKTFRSPAGNLTLKVTSRPHNSQAFNPKSCRFTFTQDFALTIVGSKSTGAFAGASGPGAAQVFFSAKVPRFTSGPKKGQCNPNGRPLAKGAVASFLASLVLTLK